MNSYHKTNHRTGGSDFNLESEQTFQDYLKSVNIYSNKSGAFEIQIDDNDLLSTPDHSSPSTPTTPESDQNITNFLVTDGGYTSDNDYTITNFLVSEKKEEEKEEKNNNLQDEDLFF